MRYFLLLLLVGCSPVGTYYPDTGRVDYSDYQFQLSYTTPGGIQVDDPEHQLDAAVVDATTANVNACLASRAPLTNEEMTAGACYGSPRYAIESGLKVIVPPQWHVSACTDNQLFACSVPNASCEAKGETPSVECPCECRAIVQLNSEIVTTPNLQVYPWRLVELATGCEHQEFIPRLAACGSADQRAIP